MGGIVGAGFDEFRWTQPVRPGNALRIETEVLEVRPSQSCPDRSVLRLRTKTLNQPNEAVQVTVGNLVIPCRPRQAVSEISGGPRKLGATREDQEEAACFRSAMV